MRFHAILASLCLAVSLSACVGGRSPNARFFQLQPSPALTPVGEALPSDVFVVVKNVTLETYLRQPQLASRVANHEIVYGEFTRWAEPLDRNISRVVTENLRTLLQSGHVAIVSQTFKGEKIVTLMLEVTRFEPNEDGTVHLKAGWLVTREGAGQVARVGGADLATRTGSKPEEIVAAQSQLLAELAAKIAPDVLAVADTKETP